MFQCGGPMDRVVPPSPAYKHAADGRKYFGTPRAQPTHSIKENQGKAF